MRSCAGRIPATTTRQAIASGISCRMAIILLDFPIAWGPLVYEERGRDACLRRIVLAPAQAANGIDEAKCVAGKSSSTPCRLRRLKSRACTTSDGAAPPWAMAGNRRWGRESGEPGPACAKKALGGVLGVQACSVAVGVLVGREHGVLAGADRAMGRVVLAAATRESNNAMAFASSACRRGRGVAAVERRPAGA